MHFTLLKEFFAGFLRNRHIGRHFRHLALLDSLPQTDVNREVPASLTKILVLSATSDTLFKHFDSHSEGLTEPQA